MDSDGDLPVGKLNPRFLAHLLAPLTPRDPRVLMGPRPGEDAAVIANGERLLVVAGDPITFATDEIGRYAVAVNANDIAVRGAIPRWFLATILLPRGTGRELVTAIMADLIAACRELDVDLVGGHTEVTATVQHPVIAGTMLGEVAPERLVTSGGAQPGDVLVLAGALAIEGTAVLAREAADRLTAHGVPATEIARARDLLHAPGICILAMARAVCDAVRPHALHDPTEGGIAMGVAELAAASHVGISLGDPHELPFLPQTRLFCAALGLDPLGLLASGALLVAVDPADATRAVSALRTVTDTVLAIGRVEAPERGLTMAGGEGSRPLPTFDRDELARVFEG